MEHKRLRERYPLLREEGLALMVARSAVHPGGQRHTHDAVEVFTVRSGSAVDIHGERRHRMRPGTVGIVHQGQSHAFAGGPVEVINLLLDLERLPPPDLGELTPALHAILPLHPSLRYRTREAVHLDLPADGAHLAALEAMLAEQTRRADGWREAMRAHLRVFLIALARRAAELGLRGAGRAFDTPPSGLERVRQRIERAFDQPLRLPELARLAGCAPATLCRGFKRYTGETVLGYAHRLRIDAAKRALGGTDDAIIDVARSSGFGDLAFFNRVFKRNVGCTPSRWRRHALGGS
jgi:AraC-like DNA-binding protein